MKTPTSPVWSHWLKIRYPNEEKQTCAALNGFCSGATRMQKQCAPRTRAKSQTSSFIKVMTRSRLRARYTQQSRKSSVFDQAVRSKITERIALIQHPWR